MTSTPKILDVTYEAGAILLENGAEISRVEETMYNRKNEKYIFLN